MTLRWTHLLQGFTVWMQGCYTCVLYSRSMLGVSGSSYSILLLPVIGCWLTWLHLIILFVELWGSSGTIFCFQVLLYLYTFYLIYSASIDTANYHYHRCCSYLWFIELLLHLDPFQETSTRSYNRPVYLCFLLQCFQMISSLASSQSYLSHVLLHVRGSIIPLLNCLKEMCYKLWTG